MSGLLPADEWDCVPEEWLKWTLDLLPKLAAAGLVTDNIGPLVAAVDTNRWISFTWAGCGVFLRSAPGRYRITQVDPGNIVGAPLYTEYDNETAALRALVAAMVGK